MIRPILLVAAVFALALAVLCLAARGEIPRSQPVRDTVAVAEVNHTFDGDGNLTFDQLLLWGEHGECIGWRLIKSPRMLPQRDWQNGGYVVLFDDGGVLREVRARTRDERWLQYDAEVLQRELIPVCQRRGLLEARPR